MCHYLTLNLLINLKFSLKSLDIYSLFLFCFWFSRIAKLDGKKRFNVIHCKIEDHCKKRNKISSLNFCNFI